MGEQDTGQEAGPLEDRVDALETGQESLSGKVDQILGLLQGKGKPHATAQQATETRLEASSTIADEVARELARAREKEDREARERGQAGELAAVKEQLAAMSEKPPRPPVRRVTRLMYGAGDDD